MSVFLSVLFCLHFVNSCLGGKILLENYKNSLNLVRKIENNKEVVYFEYNRNTKYYEICEKSKEMRSTLCRYVLRNLRKKTKDNKDYRNFYMNYLAFTIGEPCQTVGVWVDEGDILAHQTAMNCFARSAIISFETSAEMIHLFRDIVIYPWYAELFLVFEYNQDKNYYMLLDTYTIGQWNKLNIGSTLLFSTLVPQSWSEVSNLFAILFPIHSQLEEYSNNPYNIVNYSNAENFVKICYVILRTDYYGIKRKNPQIRKPEKRYLSVILQVPESQFSSVINLSAYSCRESVTKKKTFMDMYRIAAGPAGNHSVILLKKSKISIRGIPHYEISELVKNVTDDYIDFYSERYY